MIYTSYFNNVRNLPVELVPIAVAHNVPSWYKSSCGAVYWDLAPNGEVLKVYQRTSDVAAFTEAYKRQLASLDLLKVIRDLTNLSGGKGICLVDFQNPSSDVKHKYPFHKPLLTEWLRNNGFECEEWSEENTLGHVARRYVFLKSNTAPYVLGGELLKLSVDEVVVRLRGYDDYMTFKCSDVMNITSYTDGCKLHKEFSSAAYAYEKEIASAREKLQRSIEKIKK